jgi:lantibiotic leader peptide-processing serine protease
MTTLWGIRGWRAVQSCRRLVLTAAAGSAGVLAGCTDMAPVAPPPVRAVLAALPAAPRYLIELAAGQAPSSALIAQIHADGGRIVYAHAPTGIVVVAGLSAKSAGALRLRDGVQGVVADVHRMRITDPAFARMEVRSIRPSAVRVRSFTPGSGADPRNAQFFGAQWNMTVIQADSAWQVTSQGTGEKVFILDTGVDTAHVDLAGRVNTALSTSFAFATDTSTVPLPFSHDVVGHGTFVSSLIATNSLGIAAVAPQVQLVMARVLDDSGSGSFTAILEGILYATDSNADVINMSVGGYLDRTSADDMVLGDVFQRAVDYAFQRGVLLAAAAGNESVDFNTATSVTGSYVDSLELPAGLHHVLSVGATGPIGQLNFDDIASYSNFGNDGVAVFAPGGNIDDTLPSDSADAQADLVIGACSSASAICPGSESEYAVGAGTSFSSPMAAGEAAVVKGQSNTVVGQALETCIATSATEVTGKRPDPNYGFGRINVLTAVTSKSCK